MAKNLIDDQTFEFAEGMQKGDTDTSLSEPGKAADAKAVGDIVSTLSFGESELLVYKEKRNGEGIYDAQVERGLYCVLVCESTDLAPSATMVIYYDGINHTRQVGRFRFFSATADDYINAYLAIGPLGEFHVYKESDDLEPESYVVMARQVGTTAGQE